MPPVPEQLSGTIETLYRSESGRVLATLVRLLGDLDLAEEAMHEAFAAALESWPRTGIPDRPRPWLISTARFKAIDGMRRRAHFDRTQRDLALFMEARIDEALIDDEEIEDDRLRLIFTCCRRLIELSGNELLVQTVHNFWDRAHRARMITLRLRRKPVNSTKEHMEMVEMIRKGDARGVLEVNRAHRQRASRELLEIFERYRFSQL